jgi:ribonuclease T2
MRLSFLILFVILAFPAHLEAKDQGYILALSWSPAYCVLQREDDPRDDKQCESERPYGFVVHGLWNRVPDGQPYAQFCSSRYSEQISQDIVQSVLPMMPSQGLVRYTWRKHGLCSGLSPRDYFARMQQAFAKFVTPASWLDLERAATRDRDELRRDVITANQALRENMFILTCQKQNLREVRVCLDANLNFAPCSQDILKRDCSRPDLTLVPIQ